MTSREASDEEKLLEKLGQLVPVVASADTAPTKQSYQVYEKLAGQINEQLGRLEQTPTTASTKEHLGLLGGLVRAGLEDHELLALTTAALGVQGLGEGLFAHAASTHEQHRKLGAHEAAQSRFETG